MCGIAGAWGKCDEETVRAIVARDPIGIKPLYFGRRDGDLLLASEIKAFIGIAEDVREFPPCSWFH